MDEMEYPGIRVMMDAQLEDMVIPFKIDFSTGDIITPQAVEYKYHLLLEDRSVSLWSYNLETILGEKLQTVLARGVLNTRMRDFYDIHTLLLIYRNDINPVIFKKAFEATCLKRNTVMLSSQTEEIITGIKNDNLMQTRWDSYRKKYFYASDITFQDVVASLKSLVSFIK